LLKIIKGQWVTPFFDGEEAAIKHWQLKRDGKKRGIVEVLIHDS
jgi:hypothetical protein